MQYAKYESPVGTLLLQAEGGNLLGLWPDSCVPEGGFVGAKEALSANGQGCFADVVAWLDAYFRGEKPAVTFSLAPRGTAFQQMVWQRLLGIPYGETVSYGRLAGEIAGAMGKEKMSAQAIGQAVGKNPISIIIPCHRVVGAKGQLTGYAGGLDKKIWLLEHEKNNAR